MIFVPKKLTKLYQEIRGLSKETPEQGIYVPKGPYTNCPPAPPRPRTQEELERIELYKQEPPAIYSYLDKEAILEIAEAMVDDDNVSLNQLLFHYRWAKAGLDDVKMAAEMAFKLGKDKHSAQKWLKLYLEMKK